MALLAPKCNLIPVVELIVECFCCKVNLYYMNVNVVMFTFWIMWISRSLLNGQRTTAMNGICCQTDHVEVFWISQVKCSCVSLWPWPFGCLSHCPERHSVVWWDVGLGWLLIINGTSPSVAALPRPTATWRLGDLNSFVLWYFSFVCLM